MKMDELIAVANSLKENSQSFFSKDGDDEIFRKDVDALDKIIPILTVCKNRGVESEIELAAALDEERIRLNVRTAIVEKGRYYDYYKCPSCSSYIASGDCYCRNCGQKIGWQIEESIMVVADEKEGAK